MFLARLGVRHPHRPELLRPGQHPRQNLPVTVEPGGSLTNLGPGDALAKGPFVAETFPVSVEDKYIVVEV